MTLCRALWHDMLSRRPSGTQITLTDTSSANANITATTQIIHTDTSSANANITAAPTSQLDTLSGPLLTHSPLWRALRRSRKRLRTVADGCGRLRTVANGCGRKRNFWRTQPHPQTPKWNGNPRYAFGKKMEKTWKNTQAAPGFSTLSATTRAPSFRRFRSCGCDLTMEKCRKIAISSQSLICRCSVVLVDGW